MKHLPLILLIVAGAVLGAVALNAAGRPVSRLVPVDAGAKVPVELSGDVPEGHVVRRLAVEGMCKDCCPPAVYTALARVDGVVEIAVDMDGGTAAAVVPQGLAVDLLVDSLTEHDYPATALP